MEDKQPGPFQKLYLDLCAMFDYKDALMIEIRNTEESDLKGQDILVKRVRTLMELQIKNIKVVEDFKDQYNTHFAGKESVKLLNFNKYCDMLIKEIGSMSNYKLVTEYLLKLRNIDAEE